MEDIMANNYTPATVTPYLPATLFTEKELESLASDCGLTHEQYDDKLYFYAEEYFSEIGQDEHGNPVNSVELLQAKLKQLDPAEYPHIVIEGAYTCSKMRQGEFGGFAYFITRQDIKSIFTAQWIHEQTAGEQERRPA
jgi:dethiobiotin synthetase